MLICCLYLPNGNPQPGPKFDYKLAWFERLIAYGVTLLAWDFNRVPTPFDMRPSRLMATNELVQPQSRAAFARLLELGWTDAIRTRFPNEPMFTSSGDLHERWTRDPGLRIDHFLLSLEIRLLDAEVDQAVRGKPTRAIARRPGSASLRLLADRHRDAAMTKEVRTWRRPAGAL